MTRIVEMRLVQAAVEFSAATVFSVVGPDMVTVAAQGLRFADQLAVIHPWTQSGATPTASEIRAYLKSVAELMAKYLDENQ